MRDPSTCLPVSAFPTRRSIVGPTLKAHPGLYFTCPLSQTHCESCYKMPKHRGERTMEKTLYRTWRPRTLQHRSLWLHLLPAWHLKWGFAETKWFYLPCLLQAPGIFWVPTLLTAISQWCPRRSAEMLSSELVNWDVPWPTLHTPLSVLSAQTFAAFTQVTHSHSSSIWFNPAN